MSSIETEIAKAEAAKQAASARLKKARAKQRAAEKLEAERAAVALGKSLLAAANRDAALSTFRTWLDAKHPAPAAPVAAPQPVPPVTHHTPTFGGVQ